MIELDYEDFPDLVKSLNTPLVTSSQELLKLRQQMADAEMHGIWLSQYVRTLKQAVADTSEQQFMDLTQNPPTGIKMTDVSKKILLNSRTASASAKLEYVQELQGLIKNRCLMGQTFLNSMNIERSSSNFN